MAKLAISSIRVEVLPVFGVRNVLNVPHVHYIRMSHLHSGDFDRNKHVSDSLGDPINMSNIQHQGRRGFLYIYSHKIQDDRTFQKLSTIAPQMKLHINMVYIS